MLPPRTMERYTVALTSCGRFDLLERTLRSLLPRLDDPPAKVLIAEDSGNRGIFEVVQQFSGDGPPFEILVNDPPLGQIGSIDRLYSRIETEWIFHCENDWEFFADGFIGSSFALLKEFDRVSMVGLRDCAGFRPGYYQPEESSAGGIGFRLADPRVAGSYSGLVFNPGLRRMRDYELVGRYAALRYPVNEMRVGEYYRQAGFRVACHVDPAVRHIGEGRHVRDRAKRPGFANRLSRLVRKRWSWLRR